MSIFRFLFVLMILLLFGLLFTEQRIESREKMLAIAQLSQEMEILNARKQELTMLIEGERTRLIQKSKQMGSPLSPKDIVVIN